MKTLTTNKSEQRGLQGYEAGLIAYDLSDEEIQENDGESPAGFYLKIVPRRYPGSTLATTIEIQFENNHELEDLIAILTRTKEQHEAYVNMVQSRRLLQKVAL